MPFFHKNLTLCPLWDTPTSNVAKYTKTVKKNPFLAEKCSFLPIFCQLLTQKWSKNGLKMDLKCFLWKTQPRNIAKIAKKVKKAHFWLKNAHFCRFLPIFANFWPKNGPKWFKNVNFSYILHLCYLFGGSQVLQTCKIMKIVIFYHQKSPKFTDFSVSKFFDKNRRGRAAWGFSLHQKWV